MERNLLTLLLGDRRISVVNLQEAIGRFRSAAIQKGSEGSPEDHSLFEELSSSYREIISLGEPGAAAFRDLIRDESPEVRSWVAAQLLALGDTSGGCPIRC